MGFQQVCEDVVRETEGALGCLLIDLGTGLTLAKAERPGAALDDTEIMAVTHASGEMFRGTLIDQFVRSLPNDRTSSSGFVREVQVTTAFTYQFMVAMPSWDDGIAILITEKTLSLGLGWMAAHQARERLAAARRGAAREARSSAADSPAEPAALATRDTGVHTPGQRAMPVPPMQPKSRQAPEPVRRQRAPEPKPGVWEQTPAPPRAERPPSPAAAAPEAAPAKEGTAAGSRPAPPVVREPGAAAAAATSSEPAADDRPEPSPPIVAGPRAKMFRPRQSKKKDR